MVYLFAPMEGITGYLFRQIHHDLFPGTDRYGIPFVAPHLNGTLKNKEKADVDPAHNSGINVIPQILTNDAPSFLKTARYLADLGYRLVDLNLGCPSPTVVPKGKGAGFLAHPDELGRFFETVFADELFAAGGSGRRLELSVKTRLGVSDPAEAGRLFEIFDRFPIAEITVHARTREQLYRGVADRESFRKIACRKHRLIYNGNLYTPDDVGAFWKAFPQDMYPQIKGVMIGRGLVRNPALVRECQGGPPLAIGELKAFHDRLYAAYKEKLSGPAHLLGHMKELWIYWESILTEESAKALKKVRKARDTMEYESAAAQAFAGAELISTAASPRQTGKLHL